VDLQWAVRLDKLKVREGGFLPDVDVDIANWRQDLVSVVVCVVLGMLAGS